VQSLLQENSALLQAPILSASLGLVVNGIGSSWMKTHSEKKKKKHKKMFTLQVEIQGHRSYYSLFFVCLFGLFRKAQENRSFGTFTE